MFAETVKIMVIILLMSIVEINMTDGKYGMYFGKFDGLRTETGRGSQLIFGKVTGNRVTGLRTAENRWISGHRIGNRSLRVSRNREYRI